MFHNSSQVTKNGEPVLHDEGYNSIIVEEQDHIDNDDYSGSSGQPFYSQPKGLFLSSQSTNK